MPYEYMLDYLHPLQAFDDYLEMVIQYGYIVLFAAAFPAAAAISVVYNVRQALPSPALLLMPVQKTSAVHSLCLEWRQVIVSTGAARV